MFSKFKQFIVGLVLVCTSFTVSADIIGEVSTTFRAIGANDKIVIESFNDPYIPEVACYLSRAKTGGITGTIGVAEDSSDASIMCIKNANIKAVRSDITSGKWDGQEVFKKSTSIAFKSLQVVRFYDKKNHTVVYLAYSDKLIEGSPKNSVTAVPLK